MSNRYEPENDSPEARIAGILSSGFEQVVAPPAGSAEADLLQVLQSLRDEYGATAQMPDAAATARMLARIRAAMNEPRREGSFMGRLAGAARRTSLRPAWAVAAMTVIVAISLVLLRSPERSLVAESSAIAVVYGAPDGSTITLRPHSRLIDTGVRAYALEGEAYFDVARDEARPFTVSAADGIVEVLGTRFTVSAWGPTVRVFVDEGSIRFRGAQTGASVDLGAGEASELVDGMPVLSTAFGRAAALDWLEGALVFDSQPLGDVVAELGQHFDLQIQVPAELAAERLSGRILLPDADKALTDLGIVVGGEFVRTGPASFRFERK